MSKPDTILFPDAFDRSQTIVQCPHCGEYIGFDGIFDWSWLLKPPIFPRGIKPMDFDGIVEINKHYLVFETKDAGKTIPQGQVFTLERLWQMKSATIILLWGKETPETWDVINTRGMKLKGKDAVDGLRRYIKMWLDAAEKDEMSRFEKY